MCVPAPLASSFSSAGAGAETFSVPIMSADLTVQTPLGALRGRAASNNVRAFLGVRYAEKVGRWRRPEAVKPWSGVADATTYGAKPPVAPPLASLGIPLLMPSDVRLTRLLVGA